jgi:ketosteroid isomerase-like protein
MCIVLVALLGGTVWANGTPEEADRSKIEEALRMYADAVATGDAERYLALHDPDAYKMPPSAPMYTIASATDHQQDDFDAMQAAYNVAMNLEPMEIEVDDDLAYAMGTYTIEMEPKADAPPALVDGKFLTVFRQQGDGSWKIFRDCFNNNAPAPQ